MNMQSEQQLVLRNIALNSRMDVDLKRGGGADTDDESSGRSGRSRIATRLKEASAGGTMNFKSSLFQQREYQGEVVEFRQELMNEFDI